MMKRRQCKLKSKALALLLAATMGLTAPLTSYAAAAGDDAIQQQEEVLENQTSNEITENGDQGTPEGNIQNAEQKDPVDQEGGPSKEETPEDSQANEGSKEMPKDPQENEDSKETPKDPQTSNPSEEATDEKVNNVNLDEEY